MSICDFSYIGVQLLLMPTFVTNALIFKTSLALTLLNSLSRFKANNQINLHCLIQHQKIYLLSFKIGCKTLKVIFRFVFVVLIRFEQAFGAKRYNRWRSNVAANSNWPIYILNKRQITQTTKFRIVSKQQTQIEKLKIKFSSQTNIIKWKQFLEKVQIDKRIKKGQRNAKLTEPEYNCDCDEPKAWKGFLENRKF